MYNIPSEESSHIQRRNYDINGNGQDNSLENITIYEFKDNNLRIVAIPLQ